MKKNNSVLIITERFHPEEFGINDLAQAWQAQGFKVTVLTQIPSYPFDKVYEGYKNKFFQTEDWQNIKIHRIFSLMGYKKNTFLKILNYVNFAFFASFVALFIGGKCDNIFVYHIGPLTQAIPAVFIKKLFKKKVYIWTLDVWPDSVYAYGFKKRMVLKKTLDWFVKSIYENCEAVFISCKGFKDKIERYAAEVRIIYSPQWAPKCLNFEGAIPCKLLREGFNFTFAGNIGKVQNLENVIRGFACIAKNDYQANLNIVGDGSNLENLKKIVQEEGVENVFFWGRRPLKEMPQWFEGSDVLIISLIDEPVFSLTVPAKFQAYLAAGKPILCALNGETADLVNDYAIGLVADPSDISDIHKVCEKFLKMSSLEIESFKKNMQGLLKREFNRDAVIQKMTGEIFG